MTPLAHAVRSAHRSRKIFLYSLLAASAYLGGCASAPVTYKVRDDTATRMSSVQTVRGAPLDIAVDEISAGGVTERHDELTEQVGKNIAEALTHSHRLNLAAAAALESAEARNELEEVQALLRRITMNDAMPLGLPAQANRAQPRALSYEVGRIDRIADALQADAVLFVFVRDQYSTSGRKAVMVLGMLAGAAAGVAIVPQWGATASSAALVTRDGVVVWFNNLGASGLDLRTPGTAGGWVKKLLAGMPPLPTAPAITPRGIEATSGI